MNTTRRSFLKLLASIPLAAAVSSDPASAAAEIRWGKATLKASTFNFTAGQPVEVTYHFEMLVIGRSYWINDDMDAIRRVRMS